MYDLQNYRGIHSCCLKPPMSWLLVTAVTGNQYRASGSEREQGRGETSSDAQAQGQAWPMAWGALERALPVTGLRWPGLHAPAVVKPKFLGPMHKGQTNCASSLEQRKVYFLQGQARRREWHPTPRGVKNCLNCLKNSMDRGVWWITVHGIANSPTWLNN